MEDVMERLELTGEEAALLRELLERKLTDVDVEVSRTDAHDFKAMLKQRRGIIESILHKVTSLPIAA
jgi:hypothetical protein